MPKAIKAEPRLCGCDSALQETLCGLVCSTGGRDCPELPADLKAKLKPLTPELLNGLPLRQARRARGMQERIYANYAMSAAGK